MKKLIFILLMFTVVSAKNDQVYLYASNDMTTGTDSACEAYWDELKIFMAAYKTVHIVNKGWVPSPKTITR